VKKDWESIIEDGDFDNTHIKIERRPKKLNNIATNWWIFDLGFANLVDHTNNTSPSLYNSLPIVNSANLKLNNAKSSNVNIWVVQQKVNIYQHKWYFKYGFGFEMFNYFYSTAIDFRNNEKGYISLSNNTYSKDKLFVNYLTVPLQLSRSFKVKNVQTISLSGGVSLGYMLATHNKQISDALGKKKYYGDFNLNDYRMAGIFQLGVGDVKFYGSAALTNMLDKSTTNIGLFPYTFGIRLAKF